MGGRGRVREAGAVDMVLVVEGRGGRGMIGGWIVDGEIGEETKENVEVRLQLYRSGHVQIFYQVKPRLEGNSLYWESTRSAYQTSSILLEEIVGSNVISIQWQVIHCSNWATILYFPLVPPCYVQDRISSHVLQKGIACCCS